MQSACWVLHSLSQTMRGFATSLEKHNTPLPPDERKIAARWSNPSDILSLLLLVGGDVIQKALAQQAGGTYYLPPPVVFSFGWVSYAFRGLLTIMGNRLMPSPEISVTVLNMASGYHRSNQSWVIARLLRDYDRLWMPIEVREQLAKVKKDPGADRSRKRVGLCVAVFEPSPQAVAGVPTRDAIWYSGYLVATLQLLVSVVPWTTSGIWEIFAITVAGTVIAFFTASLPQWTDEKWNCGRNSKGTFVLTRGNGAQHAVVILGNQRGLHLEDLSMPHERLSVSQSTKWIYGLLTVLWCGLLITVDGLRYETWFLVAIGAIGMVHTVAVAGAPRRPETLGIHLCYKRVFAETKVMKTLQVTEDEYPGLGRCMLPIFFPGELRDDEKEWWRRARARELARKKKEAAPVSAPPDAKLTWNENEMQCCHPSI
ncbi:hypothetical protein GGR51DRAFT_538199 [Nemania sp. FL0031]|nr:hypothetical protein GGR51DRAFT_538199 [Nemania sp. FL0031]